jgi:hypothetical protein
VHRVLWRSRVLVGSCSLFVAHGEGARRVV